MGAVDHISQNSLPHFAMAVDHVPQGDGWSHVVNSIPHEAMPVHISENHPVVWRWRLR